MAFRQINNNYYQADKIEDLVDIPTKQMGVSCWVIKEACEYEQMSDGEWARQVVSSAQSSSENFVTEDKLNEAISSIEVPSIDGLASEAYVDEAIAAIQIPSTDDLVKEEEVYTKEYVEAHYRPIKYDITDVPYGTIVDYRDKEIRIFCPETVQFTKQTVGENGNPNMYYMSFKAYAPKGAVSFKEGDRGTIIDEMHTFDESAAGTDKYGRNYSICWLSLASYHEDADAWTYFGDVSTTEKYIGWTYCVEWYDANGVMIGADAIRINLSNADCHTNLKPYLG